MIIIGKDISPEPLYAKLDKQDKRHLTVPQEKPLPLPQKPVVEYYQYSTTTVSATVDEADHDMLVQDLCRISSVDTAINEDYRQHETELWHTTSDSKVQSKLSVNSIQHQSMKLHYQVYNVTSVQCNSPVYSTEDEYIQQQNMNRMQSQVYGTAPDIPVQSQFSVHATTQEQNLRLMPYKVDNTTHILVQSIEDEDTQQQNMKLVQNQVYDTSSDSKPVEDNFVVIEEY